MKRIIYILKRLREMNFDAMFQTLDRLHEKTGKSKLLMFLDMIQCALRYGAGYMDYALFEMYRRSHAQRNTYLTRGRNNALIKQYNDPSLFHLFDNKDEFYEKFNEFLRRDWLLLDTADEEKLAWFLERNQMIFAKPTGGSCGRGVEKFTREEFPEIRKSLGENMLLESMVVQHPVVSELYPHCINTTRVVTIFKNGKANIVCAYIRIGNDGKHVDNFNSGGMTAPVDLATGTVKAPAVDKKKDVYKVHPMTGHPIEGFKLPDWEQALEMVAAAASKVPEMAYIGWDVAFSENGPLIIEGNNFPGHDIYQLPAHTPDGFGVYPQFQV